MPKDKKDRNDPECLALEFGGLSALITCKVVNGQLPPDESRFAMNKLLNGDFGQIDPRDGDLVVDTGEAPYVPWDGARFKQLHPPRKIRFPQSWVEAHLMPTRGGSQGYSCDDAENLIEELKDSKDTLPATANVLDFLLDHPWLIPTSFAKQKNRKYMFWGTTYSLRGVQMYVRSMVSDGRHWVSGYEMIYPNNKEILFGHHNPIVLVKVQPR